jgi:transcriptional regulator with XRE-family HTH domain
MTMPVREHAIGTKLRGIRRLNHLTLKDVAEAVGCSESLVSKIETGKAQPSLKILHRLAAALGTTISALFADPTGEEITIHRAGRHPVVTTRAERGGGTINLERISPFGDDQLLEANIHVIDPATDSGGEISHVGEEIGYVLEGELELKIEDRTYTLKQGDSFCFRSELRHCYRNPGPSVSRVIWINTPPTF